MSKLVPTETAKFFQTEYLDEVFHDGLVIKDGIPLPLEIEISCVDACTRNCDCCPRGMEDIAPHTSLKLTSLLYNKMAKELKEIGYKGLIMLSGYGESLLHPDILDIVRAFSFTAVTMNTNGDLLTRESLIKLKEAGLNQLLISVYIRDRENFFKEISKGYEDFVVLRQRYEDFHLLFSNRAGAVGDKEHLNKLCYYPFYLLMIDANGDVYPCCQDWQRRSKIGNLYQHTFWEIWTSSAINKVRRKILEGKRDLFPCRICGVNGTYRGKGNFDLMTEGEDDKRTLKQTV